MLSRFGIVLPTIILSVLLVLSSPAQALHTTGDPGSGSQPAHSSAVVAGDVASGQTSAAPKQKRRAKNGAQAKAKKKQNRAKKEKQARAKRAKQQRRAARRAAGQTRQGTGPGQTSVPRLPGGPLRGAQQAAAAAADPGERYIVLYSDHHADSRALTTALSQEPGITPTNLYENGVNGFAGYLTPAAKEALARDPRVASIEQDRQRFLAAQTLPRAINRVDAELNPVAAINGGGPGVNVDIAIIDTGADLDHPDLNIFAFMDCTPNPQFEGYDLDGHGTHVAGTAAAIDNNDGVVGVAPGARIWSLRVEGDDGIMWDSSIIDCMDAVTLHASTPFNGQTIDVVNMSLSAPSAPEDDDCADDAFNLAVCGMVAAGVTTVVAAGNAAQDAGLHNPANMEEVITVSALADSDGLSGGRGGSFLSACQPSQVDDGLATFSNFGADVDLAAPGTDVLSTYPTYLAPSCTSPIGTGYNVLAGTSMASPHVAGAAGLLLALNPNLTPAQVKGALLGSRERVVMPRDGDGINEGILNLTPGGSGDAAGPAVNINAPKSARAGARIAIHVTANDPSGIARVELYQCTPNCRKVANDAAAPYKFVHRSKQDGRVRFEARVIDRAGNVTKKSTTVNVRPRPRR